MAQAQTDSPPPSPTETALPTPDGTPATPNDAEIEISTAVLNSNDETIESLAGLVMQLVNTMSIERIFFWLMFLLYGGYLLAKLTPTKRDDAVFERLINLMKSKEDKA